LTLVPLPLLLLMLPLELPELLLVKKPPPLLPMPLEPLLDFSQKHLLLSQKHLLLPQLTLNPRNEIDILVENI